MRLRTARTDELAEAELHVLRALLDEAFEGDFAEDDWRHTTGGHHVLATDGDLLVAHAAVVERTLRIDDRAVRTGYVEGVATRRDRRRRGLARHVLREAAGVVVQRYELGALSDGTDIPGFYDALGWERWRGPTAVDAPDGRRRTPADDGAVMVLRTTATHDIELDATLACDWRAGDVW